ncbi:hypothetical protein MNBD_ALPHA07-244 [hydrothermal vent metagenome]|uniref:Mobile element protein n=1 Tax=hydrothermal vent metagenome TaxID=652676 RepID=A0A3B0S973_9ZZZZ
MLKHLLSERGIIVSHKTIRFWVVKFGGNIPKPFAGTGPRLVTNGIQTRPSSRSAEKSTGCGVRRINAGNRWKSSCKVAKTPRA